MAYEEAYRIAEERIEEARRSGAKTLDLYAGHVNEELTLAELPLSLWQLTELQELHLPGYKSMTLPESLAQLSQLQSLNVSGNRLTTLPESLFQLAHLRTLNISSNQLTTLPESLFKLTELESLNISDNRLTALTPSLCKLTQLQELNVSDNQLTVLPDCLGELNKLRLLAVASNKITTLGSALTNLKQIQDLRIYDNPLGEFPEVIRKLTSLKELYAWGIRARYVPEWIGELAFLEQLVLASNDLYSLPASLSRLTRLRHLNIGASEGNPFGELPEPIRKLEGLRSLMASNCSLFTLPEWLGEMPQLTSLNFSENRLTDLPASLAEIEELEYLQLNGNPLNLELAAADKQGIDAVKRYLRAKAEAQVVLNEAKLILIGEGEVGKSCLLSALRGDPWEEGRPTTHGIEIKSVKVKDPDTRTDITLNGWDFGGQRVYRPTHQLFFSAPAVYLVVWKPREGPQQGFVKEWIQLVKHREPDAKILVVATHGGPGARQPDIDRQEIWDLFGKETVVDFFHVDSEPPKYDKKKPRAAGKGAGLKELKDAIAKVAAGLPEVGRSVPKRWQDVREALKRTAEAYLPLDRVMVICGEYKMDEDEATDFVRISHRLGHLIHYEHDPTLRDMVVLKPDWLATAISFVLDDEETRKKHGLVNFSRLRKLWSDKTRDIEFRYPASVHPMFVSLMERFDLSYRVAGSPLGGQADETSLIAQLVPDVRPQDDITREWPATVRENDEQQAQICRIVDAKGQSAAAEGLFYQLIVRFHKLSLGRKDFNRSVHWQRGLILEDDYNGRGLLEHVGNDVQITVRAAYPGNLLAILTREVKWLVEDFWEGLRCEVVVPCIEPCGKRRPGTGVFEVQKLIAFKRQGMTLFPCTVSGCDQAQDINCLLQNAPAAQRPSIESFLAEGFADMRFRLEDLRSQNLMLDQNLRRIMSQVDDAFRGLMRALTDEAKEGPRLFSLQPVERSALNPKGWTKKKFHVTLWCEHTRLPLSLLNKNDDEGVYEFDVTREWFAQAAPFLKVLAGTLSLVLPVAASATKLALDEVAYKTLENQLDFSKECAEAMLGVTEKTAEWLAEKGGPEAERAGVIEAQGGVLREFQAWLKKEDPKFGDLRRVLNKRQEFLWVHRDFEKEY